MRIGRPQQVEEEVKEVEYVARFPVEDVKKRLRKRGEPVTLFGETDALREKRLLELEAGDDEMKAESGRNEFLLDMRSDEEGDHKPVDKAESREVQVQRLFEPRPKEMSEADWVLRYLEVRELS